MTELLKPQKTNKIKKAFAKKLDYNIYLIAILVGLFIFSVFNILVLVKIKKDINNSLKIIEQEVYHREKVIEVRDEVKYKVDSSRDEICKDELEYKVDSSRDEIRNMMFANSFGDNFSGSTYLNMDLTDMYLDVLATGLTFTPLYNFTKVKDCSEPNCGLENKLEIDGDNMKICLDKGCLETRNNDLIYNNSVVNLPKEVENKNILSLTIGGLDSKWLVGIIIGDSYNEAGFVYYFDGNKLTPLITDTTLYKIEPKYNKQGGKIGFGGSDFNFLIVYGGYNGVAFHVYNNEITDISNFFGLRVTNKGFWPQVLRLGDGENTAWYVCSLDDDKSKFVKLWQNDTLQIQGVIDLTDKIFSNNSLRQQARCYLSDNTNEVFLIADSISSEYVLPNQAVEEASLDYQLWKFEDRGFDNSHDYMTISKDLIRKEGVDVVSAIVQELGLSIEENNSSRGYMTDFMDKASMYLSNDNEVWQEVEIKQALIFPSLSNQLYWRLELVKGDNSDYSPWLDNINQLNYNLKTRN